MKKQELEFLLEERNKEIGSLHRKLSTIREEKNQLYDSLKELKENIPSFIEDEKYGDWKEQNARFLDRYMKEYLPEHLSVEMTDDYSGYVKVKIMLDGQYVCDGSCSVHTGRNGLEE